MKLKNHVWRFPRRTKIADFRKNAENGSTVKDFERQEKSFQSEKATMTPKKKKKRQSNLV